MKKTGLLLGLILITVSMTACGGESKEGQSESGTVVSTVSLEKQEKIDSRESDEKVQNTELELPYWKGVYRNNSANQKYRDCTIDISIQFPSLVPVDLSDFAYQKDPSLVMVSSAINLEVADSLDQVFENYIFNSVERMEWYRNNSYTDFAFVAETSEETTIHAKGIDFAGIDLPAIKYTGKHTYKKDGVECSIPFVAYAADLTVAENCYIYWIVCDDSINNPTMEPLPEGTIDAYALKMGESIQIDKSSVRFYNRLREREAAE